MSASGDVIYFEYVKPPKSAKRVFIWDLDKTYLDTHFESLRGLIRTALEKAFQKRNVPGAATLLKALTAAAGEQIPLYFISASPPQIEKKIRQKFAIDGTKAWGIFFKDNLRNLRFKKLHKLKQQVGYKLEALLQLRAKLPENVTQVLFGDDSESDAVIYSLYSDICSRRLPQPELISVLKGLHVSTDQLQRILNLQKKMEAHDPVEFIFINLAADTDPDYYSKFGRRVLATFNSFQAALSLFEKGLLDDDQLVNVTRDMITNYGFTPDELARSFDNLVGRGFLTSETVQKVLENLQKRGLLPTNYKLKFQPVAAIQKIGEKIGEKILGIDTQDPWIPDHIDYLHDIR